MHASHIDYLLMLLECVSFDSNHAVSMKFEALSIRPFIGSRDFDTSRHFYKELGFSEVLLSTHLSFFERDGFGFYLQQAYVKDWVDNSMIFMEVKDLAAFWEYLQSRDLPINFPGVRVEPVRHESWGSECFLHDPAGILWHFGEFHTKR